MCGQTIQSHFGHKDVWLGCPSNRVSAEAPMVLIVDRRAPDRNRRTGDLPESRRRRSGDSPHDPQVSTNGDKPAPSTRAPQVAPKESWVKYVAKFPLRHDKVKAIASDRDREVYAHLARSRSGLSRLELLKAMRATKRTGIVDGAVRRLRVRYKLIESAEV
jgi:hypothetical protein